ncbi:PP2C family protein-serine/threonine phosphatase [Bosea sp. Root670]|uniref:PP2C family protein-serine/threonine phosphatase n=1 Tax=Bosea sp. Root670 TaxID=1736583 RepID=UPI0009E7931E|nr:PP2C family serine/threonine-protein phosphatase [Bosea sp. Root670]
MKFHHCSLMGPKGENQDAILYPFQAGNSVWCAIADGVGSSALGGLAARSSLEVVKQASNDETMSDLFAKVSKKLSQIAAENPTAKSISTTLSVLRISGDQAFIGHVGDTRISHYRGAGVLGRTRDQTEVQKLLDDGVLTKNQARRYPRRNVLLSAMSAGRDYDLFETNFTVENGDRLLLTTDGFHGKLLRGQIAELSSSNLDFTTFWTSVLAAIDSVKLDDDASCLAVEIEL